MTLVAVGEMQGDEPARDTGLRIGSHEMDGWAVVVFEGELDLDEAPAAADALAGALGRGDDGVVADLRGVTFLGSTGVRVLLEAQSLAEGAGRRLRVVQGDGPARRLFALLALDDRLDLVDGDG